MTLLNLNYRALNSNCTVNLDSGYTVFIDRNKDDRNVTLVDTGNETFMLTQGDGEAVVMIKKTCGVSSQK